MEIQISIQKVAFPMYLLYEVSKIINQSIFLNSSAPSQKLEYQDAICSGN